MNTIADLQSRKPNALGLMILALMAVTDLAEEYCMSTANAYAVDRAIFILRTHLGPFDEGMEEFHAFTAELRGWV